MPVASTSTTELLDTLARSHVHGRKFRIQSENYIQLGKLEAKYRQINTRSVNIICPFSQLLISSGMPLFIITLTRSFENSSRLLLSAKKLESLYKPLYNGVIIKGFSG